MIWMIKFLYISKYRKNIKNIIIFIVNLWMICKIIICCMYVNVYCKVLYINNIYKEIFLNNCMKLVYYYVGVL